ncbi:unnamed protein product, partial [Mesorhabditis spiculigera]
MGEEEWEIDLLVLIVALKASGLPPADPSGGDGRAQVQLDARSFQVALDAKYFTSKDISVKVLGDMVEIRMEHEATGAFGGVKRSVTRCYRLPEKIDPATIKSELNKDGQLVIKGTRKPF